MHKSTTMRLVGRELAEEFAKGLVDDLRTNEHYAFNLLNWNIIETILVFEIQTMTVEDALNTDMLSSVAHSAINKAIKSQEVIDLDERLDKLLEEDVIELVVTPQGKLAYRWK